MGYSDNFVNKFLYKYQKVLKIEEIDQPTKENARDDVRPFPNNWILEHIPIDKRTCPEFIDVSMGGCRVLISGSNYRI
jgi:hypothetical protein